MAAQNNIKESKILMTAVLKYKKETGAYKETNIRKSLAPLDRGSPGGSSSEAKKQPNIPIANEIIFRNISELKGGIERDV